MASPCSEYSLARCVEIGIKSCYKCDQWREALVLDYHRFVIQGKPRPQKFKCVRVKALPTNAVAREKAVVEGTVTAERAELNRTRGIRRAQVIEDTPELHPRKRPKKHGSEFIWTEASFEQAILRSDENALFTPKRNHGLRQEATTARMGANESIVVLANPPTLPPPPPPNPPEVPAPVPPEALPQPNVLFVTPTNEGIGTSNSSTKSRNTLPSVRQFVYTLMPNKWKTKQGSHLDRALHGVVLDEAGRVKVNVTKSRRRINLDLLGAVLWRLLAFLYMGRWLKSRFTALANCVFGQICDKHPDIFRPILTKYAKRHIRKEVFQAWKFQRTIDLEATGGLNYECLNSIRRGVEELERFEIGLTPERSAVARAAKLLEEHAIMDLGLGFTETRNEHGPTFKFDLDILLRMALTGHGLDTAAETTSRDIEKPVLIAYTLDGAQLTNALGHVTAGIKIVDPRAKDPITGIPLHLSGKYQSRDLCFPAQITFGRDCKALYEDCFQAFFDYFNDGCKVSAQFGLPELSNFRVLSPQDMSSIWKTVGLGGGSHSKEYFCYCCSCRKQDIRIGKVDCNRCSTCVRLLVPSCFCHEVNDETRMCELSETLESYIVNACDEGFVKLALVKKQSKILTRSSETTKLTNAKHIDFQPSNHQDSDDFKAMITRELKYRLTKDGLRTIVTLDLEGRREYLRSLMKDEDEILKAKLTVDRVDAVNLVKVKLLCEQAIPCILHAEMRVNEKLFYSLLSMALDRYPEGQAKTRKAMISRVEQCMKTVVMGELELGRGAQWKFPLKKGGKEVEPRSLTGVSSRKCVYGLATVATLVFSADLDQTSLNPTLTRLANASLLQKWITLLEVYIPMMELSKQHSDLTEEQIDEFHCLSQAFMKNWVALSPSVTNYIHMFGAGHMTYYLRKYGNLYQFSQQGWEALNQKLKHFYFNNTNHGGCSGSSGPMQRGDHIRGLMRMCQRFIVWRLGLGTAFFENINTQAITSEDNDEEIGLDEFNENERTNGIVNGPFANMEVQEL